MVAEQLALCGGGKAIQSDPGNLFVWPIVTAEDEEAVLAVLRAGSMSGSDVSKAFEGEYAAATGRKYALTFPNGTEAIRSALWALGVGAGDEIICPSMTYWASCTSALTLGAAVNFADIEPDTLCIDPDDIEHRIGPRTRVIVVVHYAGHPCAMDRIMEIARRHGVKVLEDASHAHGGLYKGRMVGTWGDVAAMSMMSGKAFPIGEAGMMLTDDRAVYERCISYGFYERTGVASRFNAPDAQVTLDELKPYAGLPMGGYKHRLNQMASAMGRVQLKHYPARMQAIQDAMNRFWDLLDGVPGIRAHRPPRGTDCTMGGWYAPRGLYRAGELGGLPCSRFCEAIRAEGFAGCWPGGNAPLHLHPMFHTADIFRMGQPTMLSFGQRDVRQGPGTLPVSESIGEIAFGVPWFKHDRPAAIREYAEAFRKVAESADQLR
ncbi:MAG: L-glutamine:2-deoxy-scyllo-inosose aminotransferase [Lentisphaerae bacterium ADurb.BinA184]|nr:MAG: L-glutamine:2-deoxy-scyllo-inosose aminotransferase [Lentisphaerae bacterium ADurb.BinA184]